MDGRARYSILGYSNGDERCLIIRIIGHYSTLSFLLFTTCKIITIFRQPSILQKPTGGDGFMYGLGLSCFGWFFGLHFGNSGNEI